ncbi:hypothetical protein GS860_16150 [Rhodococcus hoagii]|nr:hypothetical protein [Prescottella equi]
MGSYEVVATFWEEPCPDAPGGYVRHLHGSVIDVPAEHLERLLRIGAVTPTEDKIGSDTAEANVEVAAAENDSVVTESEDSATDNDSAAEASEVETVERPKQAAAKSVWVEYAVARGMDRDQAEALDKRDLIAELS